MSKGELAPTRLAERTADAPRPQRVGRNGRVLIPNAPGGAGPLRIGTVRGPGRAAIRALKPAAAVTPSPGDEEPRSLFDGRRLSGRERREVLRRLGDEREFAGEGKAGSEQGEGELEQGVIEFRVKRLKHKG
jgi:hypothetical protein